MWFSKIETQKVLLLLLLHLKNCILLIFILIMKIDNMFKTVLPMSTIITSFNQKVCSLLLIVCIILWCGCFVNITCYIF